MAIELTLTQTAFLKKGISAKDILLDDLAYGVVDSAWRLIDPRDFKSDFYCFYDPNKMGCGVRVHYTPRKKESLSITIPTPGTERDIEVSYLVLERVMKKWNLSTFLQDGTEYTLDDIPHLKEKMKQFNLVKFTHLDTRSEKVVLACVKWPIVFSSEEINEYIEKEDLEGFTNKLHKLQENDYYYAIPRLFPKGINNEVLAVYAISPDTETILPKVPTIDPPIDDGNRRNIHCNTYEVGLISYEDHGVIARLSYEDFKKEMKLEECEEYDVDHYLLKGLSEEELHILAEKYRSTNEEEE